MSAIETDRKLLRNQMQSQRSARKRQLYEVAPSPPKSKKQHLAADSPSKGPLTDNSDDESLPSFRVKSFYGNRRKLEIKKCLAMSQSPESESPLPSALIPGKTQNITDGKRESGRVALSPIKNIINNVKKAPKVGTASKVTSSKRRLRSLPAKTSSNAKKGNRFKEAAKSSDGHSDVTDTPNTNRKFFKYKSPASAAKEAGGIIVGKGFKLKFRRGCLKKDPGKSQGQKTDTAAVVSRSTPRAQKTYNRQNKKPAQTEVRKDLLAASSSAGTESQLPSSNDTLRQADCFQLNLEKPNDLHDSSNVFDDEAVKPDAQSLFGFDSGSTLSQPFDTLPVDDDSTLASVSPQNEESERKIYSIFTKKRRSQRVVDSHSSPATRIPVNSNDSQKRKFITTKGDDKQLMLDAGQERFGAVQCELCGMVYSPSDATDEATHTKFHQNAIATLKFPGWKKERVIKDFLDDGSRVVAVHAGDQRFMLKKVEEVNKVMGQELGYPDQPFSLHGNYKAFLYISDDKRVEGCCIAESLTHAYRSILPDKNSSDSHRSWLCSDVPEPACVGIGRLWVYGPSRKRGIATRLLDCIRQWFEYGIMINKSQVAFSDPTPDGRRFAAKYTGNPNFLVYKYNH